MKLHILAIGVHPDDVELGCTGTLINHIRKGQQAGILDLTQGELGSRGTIETRHNEAQASAGLLGIAVRENLKMADGFFQNDREHQLKIIQILRKYQPDIVLANALADRHPDHGRAGRLIADACFLSGLRKIETTFEAKSQQAWRPKKVFHYLQDRFTEPDFIVDISESMDLKMEGIKCFKTQFFNDSSDDPQTYISAPGFMDKIKNRASQLGHRIGAKYGEGFSLETSLGISDLDAFQYSDLV
ncbi:bacillithiol biosynthesis deacetylase BshB1 [Taibaiella lutea]|uniref:Bacillithiol biosynthesis deacetylase BshB1 n=1 Tax=Taibaiella lutea TaxID=2608001 RepID=A0A5M6CDR3_9BACT|nr:bacillithiol biosynthesis deacetylase BshB1 [Taibaiella lutea]KAA5533266.1 bacillithiol biosynthesis deacetylase BshB1 [Taibaiella lutea]